MLKVDFNPFPIIETERLLLRRYSLSDAEELFQFRKNEEAMKYNEKRLAKSIDDIYDLINLINSRVDANEGINWAVILIQNNKLIGMVSLHKIYKEHHRAELGYMLDPSYWSKGIASEAVKAVLDYGFNNLNLHSIEAMIDPNNSASKKLLTKFNFIKEAYFKENTFFNEKYYDTEVYSLLNH